MSTVEISKTETKKSSKYTEDWITVKSITNGMIQLDNGEFVTGIKVSPKNIFILDQESQNRTIYNIRSFYNVLDCEFWLVIADRPVDINMYLAQLQLLYQKTASNVTKKIIMQDINKANAFMGAQFNVVDTEYFILFKERRPEIIQKRIHNMVALLAKAELDSTQVSNSDLRMILDNFLNGGMTTNLGTVIG